MWALVAGPAAWAWTWPADGAVLREFSVGTDKYAGGQHRGIDVALGDAPSTRAPASGEVTFAGSLPTYGATVTIATAGGYRATLTHLGDLRVRRGEQVSEGQPLADAGTSGEPEHAVPYVHLGIRLGSDEDYVDPLSLLPSRGAANPPPAPAAPPAPPPPPSQAAPVDQSAASGSAASAPTAPQPTSAGALDGSGAQAEPADESSALPGLTMTVSASRRRPRRRGAACGARPTPFGRRAAHDVAWGALGSRRDVTRTRRRTRVPTPASRLARMSAARDSPSRDLVARPIRLQRVAPSPAPSVPRHQGATSAQQLRRAATLHSPTPQAAARRGTHVLRPLVDPRPRRGVQPLLRSPSSPPRGSPPRRWGGQRATPYHSRP